MFETNRIFKNNMLLSVCILLCLQTLHVFGEKISIYSLEDAIFDVTTIYRITNMSIIDNEVGFKSSSFFTKYHGNYEIEIHSRAKAVGIPIQNEKYKLVRTNIKELFNVETIESFQNSRHLNISFIKDSWRVKRIFPNGDICDTKKHYGINSLQNTDTAFNSCFKTFECRFYYNFRTDNKYKKHNTHKEYNLFSLNWIPDIDYTCLSITYINKMGFRRNISMKVVNEHNELISEITLENTNDMKLLKLTDVDFMKDQKYLLTLEIPGEYYSNKFYNDNSENVKIGLFRIAQCSNNDEEVRTVVIDNTESYTYPKPLKIFGNNTIPKAQNPDLCLNSGYFINTTNTNEMCICPPGYKGRFCETACGMNSHGPDCNTICSINDNMCRGMFMCTDYECTCLPGLTGPLCNEDCKPGRYGLDCRQTCSENCQNNICDQYTGDCLNGCSSGYMLPNCIKKYPYLANAPTPVSIEYETINFELNFQSNNIKGGDGSIHVKYYQILYKSLSEDKFRYSDIKLINQNDNRTLELLDGLLPETKYLVGILLIMDDGNHNDQDIVYGEYMTSCQQPHIIDYNVKFIRGVKSINVTWNKITSDRLECNVIEYVLTLQYPLTNQSFSIINHQQDIITNSDTNHLIDNLLPGFQYNVQLTPKTIKGPLLKSPTYSITTLIRGKYVSIKNLTVKNHEGKIKINWKLINLHSDPLNEPLTCTIKYKILQILSCSLKEIERNWTSIKVFNKTHYEILDVIPNSQYIVQVLVDDEEISNNQKKNIAYILTSETYPKTEPILDNVHPIYVTNSSVKVQWKIDSDNCSKLNGFFSKFFIQLTDNDDTMLQTKETKQNYIIFDGLESNTEYKLKVFIKTHVGYNPEHFLFVNFTTKYDNLMPVEDLMVYKKSLKNRMAGFRWSYVLNPNVDGFIVSFNDTTSVIPLERCSAWPQYYCHTFYDLSPSNNYTFRIMPRSPDYPEGGKVSSILFNNIDGLPDPPMNLKTTKVGSNSITLQWDIPWIFNSVIKLFIINAEEISAIDMNTCCVSFSPIEILFDEEFPTYNYTLTDLKPGSTYSIGVLAVSKSLWFGPPNRISIETLH